jgi:hypothetical protein
MAYKHSVTGLISSVPGSRTLFVGAFSMDGFLYTANGTFNTNGAPHGEFISSRVTISFNDIDALTTLDSFTGIISVDKLDFTVMTGYTMKGPLSEVIERGAKVTGQIGWTKH